MSADGFLEVRFYVSQSPAVASRVYGPGVGTTTLDAILTMSQDRPLFPSNSLLVHKQLLCVLAF